MVKRFSPWPWIAPTALVLGCVAFYPFLKTLGASFTDSRLGGTEAGRFVFLENYLYLLRDPGWWRAVLNTALFTVSSVALETGLGLGVALLLNSAVGGKGWLRAAVLVPWAIPAVVSARIWAWMFNDFYGVINEILLKLGWIREPLAWLAENRLALPVLVLVDVWKTTPFMALLLLAGLQSIPREVLEASRLDGAGAWARFRFIVLPLLKPALLVAVLFRSLDALRVFDLPYVLTSNSRETAVVSVYARQQLVGFRDLGVGSAASILILGTAAGVAAIYLILGRKSLGWEKERA